MRAIVKNCYKHHGREDLLHVFSEDHSGPSTHHIPQAQAFAGTMVQTINNPDGTVSFIQIDTSPQSVVTLADGTQATVVHAVSLYLTSGSSEFHTVKHSGTHTLTVSHHVHVVGVAQTVFHCVSVFVCPAVSVKIPPVLLS